MLHRLLLLCVLAAATPVFADPAALEPFRGTWVRVDTERDDAAREAVIDRVTEPMNFVFRGFARRVMRERMKPVESYTIEGNAGVALIRSNIGEEYPLDGKPHGGSEADAVISSFEDGLIRQSWRHGEDSHGVTLWRLDASGERLIISDRVHDPHFEQPIEFETTYGREAPEAGKASGRSGR